MLMMALVLPLGASAAGTNLYEAWVPVEDQGMSARQEGFQQGLEVVLRRLTGRSDLMTLAELSEARQQVNNLVSRFNYRDTPEAERLHPELRYQLQVSFNKAALDRLLRG